MALREPQQALLLDQQGHALGEVTVREVRDQLVFGEFQEGCDFAAVAPLFAEHREAADQQLFSRVDELDEAIEALGLRLHVSGTSSWSPLRNVSIGGGRITLRLCELATGESATHGATALSSAAKDVSAT